MIARVCPELNTISDTTINYRVSPLVMRLGVALRAFNLQILP